MDNEFKEIPEFPEYIINSSGEVYSKRRIRNCKDGRKFLCGGKRVIGGPNTRGYPTVMFSVDGKRKRFQIHRLVAQLFVPNDDPKNKREVNHKDGNKLNNCAENLEWTNGLENTRHAYRTGLCKKKLSLADADLIRELKNKLSVDRMAKAFGVTTQTISLVLRNKIWTMGSSAT